MKKRYLLLAAAMTVAVLSGKSVHAEETITNSFLCGGDELMVNAPVNELEGFVVVNGIQYDYSNMYAPREGEGTMIEYGHNNFSVFLILNGDVKLRNEGRLEDCKEVK